MTSHSHDGCSACQIIDALDGKVDGKLFNLEHWSVPDERVRMRRLHDWQERAADVVTGFAGSLWFVYLHAAWFLLWILDNVGAFGLHKFDEFPFGLLTMIVSLEAIFLSTFVMVSQNRQAARSEVRSQVDFESNLQSLIWSVHIASALNVDINHVESLCKAAIAQSRGESKTPAN